MHCGRYLPPPLSRRQFLSRCGQGFGALAFAALQAEQAEARGTSPLAVKPPHFPPKARNVIFLYMDGGVSQIDSFDPKPLLDREHGKPFSAKIEPTQFDNIGTTLKSPWKFRPYGESGIPVSDLFPHVGECVDDLCIIRSMVSNFSEHNTANYFLHSGMGMQGRPSMGAWIGYGLGTENQELPGYIVVNGGLIPSGGIDCFGSGFLPATYQATMFRPRTEPVANILPRENPPSRQRAKLDMLRRLDQGVLERYGEVDAVESAIVNYELAFRMQAAVPELTDLSTERAATKRLYGLEAEFEPTRLFAQQCLLARRMVERGVRFVELTCPRTKGNDRWDAHSNLRKNHRENALATDQPIAALLRDLKTRGLLNETIVVWAGEFGRTPFAQGSDGRDHNPFGFTIWAAGGGFKGGFTYGATDEFGYRVVENRVEIHDLHAMILHLLGLEHTKLTFRFGGRDMRLTDVHGHIWEDLLA